MKKQQLVKVIKEMVLKEFHGSDPEVGEDDYIERMNYDKDVVNESNFDELKKYQKTLEDSQDFFRKKAEELKIDVKIIQNFNKGNNNLLDAVFKADYERTGGKIDENKPYSDPEVGEDDYIERMQFDKDEGEKENKLLEGDVETPVSVAADWEDFEGFVENLLPVLQSFGLYADWDPDLKFSMVMRGIVISRNPIPEDYSAYEDGEGETEESEDEVFIDFTDEYDENITEKKKKDDDKEDKPKKDDDKDTPDSLKDLAPDEEIDDLEGLQPDEEIDMGPPADSGEIQDHLEAALGIAKSLGDEKLINQIGNTITFYTRSHVVGQRDDEGGGGVEMDGIPLDEGMRYINRIAGTL